MTTHTTPDVGSGTGHVSSKRYARLLALALEAVETMTAAQFRLGDIALEIEPMHDQGVSGDGAYAVLEAFANEIGLPFNTLRNYRSVASAWPKQHRSKTASFRVHHELAYLQDRFDVIKNPPNRRWTCDDAARAAAHAPRWPRTQSERVIKIHDLAPDDETAATVTRDFLRRPQVVAQVVADPTARHALDRARYARDAQQIERVRDELPAAKAVQHRVEFIELLGAAHAFVSTTQRTLPTMIANGLSPDEQASLEAALKRVHLAADWCAGAVASGDDTMDTHLMRMIEEGDTR
ncbi:DUF6192 family protein [Oerskovia turbata]